MPGAAGFGRPVKRSVTIAGHETSISLEPMFWAALERAAADEPARLLELISPGGLEEAFRIIDTAPDDFDLGPVISPYGCEGDLEATMPIIEKYGLTFG